MHTRSDRCTDHWGRRSNAADGAMRPSSRATRCIDITGLCLAPCCDPVQILRVNHRSIG